MDNSWDSGWLAYGAWNRRTGSDFTITTNSNLDPLTIDPGSSNIMGVAISSVGGFTETVNLGAYVPGGWAYHFQNWSIITDLARRSPSILPLLKGPVKDWRTAFLSEYFMETNFPRVPSWQAVRNERWKYVHYTELQGMDELYDLKSDPLEMKNLIFDAASTLEGMKMDLDRFNQTVH